METFRKIHERMGTGGVLAVGLCIVVGVLVGWYIGFDPREVFEYIWQYLSTS